MKRIIDLLGEDIFQEITNFLEDDNKMTKFVLTKVFKDKSYRTSIHTAIREVYKGLLDTTTTPDEEIKITFSKGFYIIF